MKRNRRGGAFCTPLLFFVLFTPAGAQVEFRTPLELPSLELITDSQTVRLQMSDFDPFGYEGDPRLLVGTYTIVLPANTDLESVKARIEVLKSEVMTLPADLEVAGPRSDGDEIRESPEHVVDGLNMKIYGTDEAYPGKVLGSWRTDFVRGWKTIDVQVYPVQFRPESSRIEVALECELVLEYELVDAVPVESIPEWLEGRVVDQGLQSMQLIWTSYDVAPEDPNTSSRPSYLIITTETILREDEDNGLEDFVEHKELLGFNVKIKTVEDIDSTYSSGDLQTKIRDCIEYNYRAFDLEYVLLVGNPDPAAADTMARVQDPGMVPMRICWPDGGYANSSPTDQYYTDFDDWDIDSDGLYAEGWDETGSPDIMLGRIAPAGGYVDDVVDSSGSTILSIGRAEKLRQVFEKMIRYDREFDKSWRYGMLPVGSYMYGVAGSTGNSATTLTATVRAIRSGDSRFSAYSVYQDGGPYGVADDEWFDGVTSPEASGAHYGDATIGDGLSTPFYTWVYQDFGLVFWRAHGKPHKALVGGDDYGTSTKDGIFLSREWILSPGTYTGINLDEDHPSVVFSASCANFNIGYDSFTSGSYDAQRTRWSSLAQTLQHHGAVSVIAATGATSGEISCPTDPYTGQSAWYQRRFLRRLVSGQSLGGAFSAVKRYVQAIYDGDTGKKDILRDWLRINLLGDPSQVLMESTDDYPDDRFDAGAGNDSLDYAAEIYGDWSGATKTVKVTGAISKDGDCYVLNDLGLDRKRITVTLERNRRLGDIYLEVYNADRNGIVGTQVADASSRVFTSVWKTKSPTIYIRVKKGQYINLYDLEVTLER